ncbi:hypothetical protein LOK49_LG10G01789 [Camellia lanceoleosa]|uniref:Uncharacterized protein n=1 Tax=Camellia lanceoleosa TaxID=1840588 RepID=A0ACC0GF48_9ERIC|nr:hypothetical protein LOK49_LG10G01789 [Camellia lanceoleosa]
MSFDSSHNQASMGRMRRRTSKPIQRKQCGSKMKKVEKVVTDAESGSVDFADTSLMKKRCAWVTTNSGISIHQSDVFYLLNSWSPKNLLHFLTTNCLVAKNYVSYYYF